MINNRYKIIRKIGEGRSKVYLCEDILRVGKRLAIKILYSASGDDEKKSFRDEYFLLKKLNHPNIISVFEYGVVVSLNEDDNKYEIGTTCLFFTLEYFDGRELFEYQSLQQEPNLVKIICQISSVLYYLHQSSYIYYDLKSENILIKEKDGSPVIKFIDFGLTAPVNEVDGISARGTAEYIAPEILRKEKIDHRADLYSFGILLYRIIYGKFPFRSNEQLDIYKEHLEGQFEFPDTQFSDKLINLVRNLLSKEAGERFYTSIGIISEINSSTVTTYKNEWTRIPVFNGRRDSFSIISTYIEKENGGEVLNIKGAEGAGKTTLLDELNYKYPFSLLLSADQTVDYTIWQVLLRGILYRQDIYANLDSDTLAEVKRILNGKSGNIVEDLKAVIIKLISGRRFTLLIDNFNRLNNFDLEIFLQLIPVLQVNKIKIVLTEDSSYEYKSNSVNSLQVINLNPFTEQQVTEFVHNSFAEFYPKDELKKAVVLYSDLLPGSIEIFLKDLIVLDILKFTINGPELEIDEGVDRILKGSQEDIYRFRINNLDSYSKDLAILLSLFNINLDISTITHLTNFSKQKVANTLTKLSEANILHFNPVLGIAQFTSHGIKDYICSTIENLREAHFKIADLIVKKIPHFNNNELARHWELAGKFEKSYETLKEELNKARNTSALSYERNLLEHLSKLPLEYNSLRDVKIELSNCLFQIGELSASIVLMNELLNKTRSVEEEISLKILLGKVLIASQSLQDGKAILETVLPKIEKDEIKNEILAEIAEAELEMAKYEEAEKLVDQLIADQFTSAETKGKVFRIKGLIQLFKNSNPDFAVKYFKESLSIYKRKKLLAKVASMENNLGNMFNILHARKEAEEHWNKAIEMNSSIGNIQQQGGVLINYGIYHFENCNFEKATEQYLSALPIFKAVGDKFNIGLVLSNLGEVHLMMCEYEKAKVDLESSVKIFDELNNKQEKCESLFLIGKLYLSMYNKEALNSLISKIYLIQRTDSSERLNLYLSYLNIFAEKIFYEKPRNVYELRELKSKLESLSGVFTIGEIYIEIISDCLSLNLINDAILEINSEQFLEICEKNVFFESYRFYLLGKITDLSDDIGLEPALVYFEKAFEKISNISITELTWRILFSLYKKYKSRGNISQMAEFKHLSLQTIDYIADQISSDQEKADYLNRPELQNALFELEK